VFAKPSQTGSPNRLICVRFAVSIEFG